MGLYIAQVGNAMDQTEILKMTVCSLLVAFAISSHMICTGGMASNITTILVMLYCLSPAVGVLLSPGASLTASSILHTLHSS